MSEPYLPKYVPDEGPLDARILFVGEAPGTDEHNECRPFVGESGRLLMDSLGRHGLLRENVRLANLFHHKPDGNKIQPCLVTPLFKQELKQLYEYIDYHKEWINVIVPLGAIPLKFITGRDGIMKWRGSILSYIHDQNIKVIPTIHPAAILRKHELYPTFDLDLKRVSEDSAFKEKNLPVREFIINPQGLEAFEWVARLCDSDFVSVDIETIKNSRRILCCGFTPNWNKNLSVVFKMDEEQGRNAVAEILRNDVDKVFQFGTFDVTQLKENGFEFNNGRKARLLGRHYYWDTMVGQHIIAPELPRSLEYLTSIHTREPYYKTVGRGSIPDDNKGWSEQTDKQSLYVYNGRDTGCTLEIVKPQLADLEEENLLSLFDFEMAMLEVTEHISMAGMFIDDARRGLIERVLLTRWQKKQTVLNTLVGAPLNAKSPKVKDILYKQLGLPVRKNHQGGITADEDAIVACITYCKDHIAGLKTDKAILEWEIKLAICKLILEIRGIRQVLSNYILKSIQKGKIVRAGSDGRIRSTYKQATETGRWSCSKYVDGSGFNAQTLPRDPVEIPDEVMEEFNKELMAQLDEEKDEEEIEEEEE